MDAQNAAPVTRRVTFVPPNHVLLLNGRLSQLPPSSTVEIRDGDFIITHPAFKRPDKVTRTLCRADTGTVQWSIEADPDVQLALANEQRTIILPAGVVDADRPLQNVLQEGKAFVYCLRRTHLGDLSGAVVAVDQCGRELWRRSGDYYAVGHGDDATTVTAHRDWFGETLNLRDGALLSHWYEK